MTRLRKMMLEELQLRDYAQNTIRHYVRTVEDFARRFRCSPDRLGPRHIREYQAELFQKRKLSANSVRQHLAALRFFYIKTLRRTWSIVDTQGATLYWTLIAFASYAILPPTIVSTDSVFGNSGGGTLKISCESTVRSANFPDSRLPLSFSANSA